MTSVIRPARHRYPDAVRQDLVEEIHGLPVPDPYRWLEDAEATQARRWGEEQDALYEARRTALPGLERWRAEVAALADIAPAMTPKVRGDRVFRLRQDGGREHPVLMVKEGEEGTERVLLDPSALDPSGRTVLDAWQPSLEGDLLAFQVSLGGTEDSLLRVIDVATGTVVDGPVDRMRKSSIGWLPGGGAFYYVRQLDPRLNPGEGRYHRRVYLHRVGSAPDTDALVFGEGRDRTQFYSVSVTADGRWLGVTATLGTGRGTDLYLADLSAAPLDRPLLRPVQEGREAVTRLCAVPGTGPDDPVWLRTDRGAPRGHVVACRPADLHLGPGAWREVIAERPDAILTHLVALSGPELPHPLGLAAWTRRTVAEVTVHDLVDGRQLATVPLPGTGAVGDFSAGPHGSHDAWFTYTDFVTPPRVLHFDARTCRVTPWEPGAQDAGTVGERSPARSTSRPGTARRCGCSSSPRRGVRMSRARRCSPGTAASAERCRPVTGPRCWPGSGRAGCSPGRLRGGGEEGEQWHRAGSGEHKQNTFDDFDAATDHLVSAGWADGRIAIMGGSNGGLLVGAALTQHPEKYAAVVCMSPLLDMVRYELSGLGPSWVPEYGSARDPARLRTLLGYSPITASPRAPRTRRCC